MSLTSFASHSFSWEPSEDGEDRRGLCGVIISQWGLWENGHLMRSCLNTSEGQLTA